MNKKEKKSNYYQWIFMFTVMILYLIAYFFSPEKSKDALISSLKLLWNILPILIVVFIFMVLSSRYLSPKAISKHVGEASGAKGWLVAITAGILSHGPIYVWFPLLKDLKSHGMRDGLVAAFLYNRSIKLPLLPVMIFYFGWVFVVVLMVMMMTASFIEGKLIEMIEGIKVIEG
ncbi:MAG: permease [Thermoplasmata archaeon]